MRHSSNFVYLAVLSMKNCSLSSDPSVKLFFQFRKLFESSLSPGEPKIFQSVRNYYRSCMDEAKTFYKQKMLNSKLRIHSFIHWFNDQILYCFFYRRVQRRMVRKLYQRLLISWEVGRLFKEVNGKKMSLLWMLQKV